MKTFKDGDFVIDFTRSSLYIYNKGYLSLIKMKAGVIQTKGYNGIAVVSDDDFVNHSDIIGILGNDIMPQWVNDIRAANGKLPWGSLMSTHISSVVASSPLIPGIGPKVQPKAKEPELNSLATFRRTCPHKWKAYVGFSSVYEFCVMCDEKR